MCLLLLLTTNVRTPICCREPSQAHRIWHTQPNRHTHAGKDTHVLLQIKTFHLPDFWAVAAPPTPGICVWVAAEGLLRLWSHAGPRGSDASVRVWYDIKAAGMFSLPLSLYISIALSYIYSLSLRQHGDTAAVFSIYTEWTAEDCAAHPEIWFLMSEKKSSLLFQSYMYFNIHLLFSNNWFALYSNHSLSWGGSSLHTVQIRKIFWLEEKDLGMFVVLIKIRA